MIYDYAKCTCHDIGPACDHCKEVADSAGVAQGPEQGFCKPQVAGSIPVSSSKIMKMYHVCSVCEKPIKKSSTSPTGWTHENYNIVKPCYWAPDPKEVIEMSDDTIPGPDGSFTEDQKDYFKHIVHFQVKAAEAKQLRKDAENALLKAQITYNGTKALADEKIKIADRDLKKALEVIATNENLLRKSILEDVTMKGLPIERKQEKEESPSQEEEAELGRAE